MPELNQAQMDFLQALSSFAREHGCTFGSPERWGLERAGIFCVHVPVLGLRLILTCDDIPGRFTLKECRTVRIGYRPESERRSEWSVE